MRSRALVGAYWRLARDLARAFGARYVIQQGAFTAPSSLTSHRCGVSYGGPSLMTGEGSAPLCNHPDWYSKVALVL